MLALCKKMLVGNNSKKVIRRLNNVIATCVQQGRLDVFSMCEVGGHSEGFKSAGINAAGLQVLQNGPLCSNIQNYLTMWNFHTHELALSVKILLQAKVHRLSMVTGPQLLVEVFSLHDKAKLVLGNLHTRTPHGAIVTKSLLKLFLVEALRILESTASELQQGANDETSQPVVCALLGDNNLYQAQGEE